jgi:dTDP-4-amino-4,6-dideoxygalactose transaminase
MRLRYLIPINMPQFSQEEIDAVVSVMKSGLLTTGLGAGPRVSEFEKNYAAFANVKHAIAVNTGTAALHAAVLAAGIKAGDEIILPAFTFVATAEAAALAGAKIVFADIDPKTFCLSPEAVQKALTPKTKAVIPVDLYGLPADTARIKQLVAQKGIAVIEDCAQSHGATYNGASAGKTADLACWSLYAAKNIGTGEGGMVTTDDDELAEKVRMVRTHGEKTKYNSLMLGTNYRMTEIQAAIGSIQLKRLPEFFLKRKKNAEQLTSLLEKSGKIGLLALPPKLANRTHSWYLYTVRIKDKTREQRDNIISVLRDRGIGADAYYPIPINEMPFYRQTYGCFDLPETKKASEQVISLPIHPAVTEQQIQTIGETFLSLL